MKYYDISQVNEKGMARYPTTADFKLTIDRDYDTGFDLALSHFEMSSHLGTHLDSPYHMIKGGKKIEDLPLDRESVSRMRNELIYLRQEVDFLKKISQVVKSGKRGD